MAPQRDFEPDPRSARAVRRFVASTLGELPRLDDVLLAASELASNVIRHAKTQYAVRLVVDPNRVLLEISDGSSIVPAVEGLADSKRGLRLVDAVSDKWGVEGNQDGKTVWAEFTIR